MAKTLYKEEQKFGQPWIWLIFLPATAGSLIFFSFGLHKQLFLGEPFGDNPMSDTGLIGTTVLVTLMMIGVTVLFYKMKLVVEIRDDGIHYRYPPMIKRFRKISRDEIERLEVREYKPIKEFGGWGIKVGSKKYGKAFNVRGNMGLQLYLKNGSRILFGTQRKAAIGDAASRMMNASPDGPREREY